MEIKTTIATIVLSLGMICLSEVATSANSQPISPTTEASNLAKVQTTSGLVQGFTSVAPLGNTNNNQTIYKFLSVPYAQAPLGALRFKRPVELVNATSDTLVDATKFGHTCPQYRHLARFVSPLLNLDHEHRSSEDCLRLSIYAPSVVGQLNNGSKQLEVSKQLPVIVWIPGEGFDFADERQFDGSHLARETQSIVVSVQYRVGILGFLSDPKLNITGNMGAYDQLAALRWIKRNINSFGGDHERVTLMGRFSGSMTISTMLTAPQKQLVKSDQGEPLFKRAILLSGLAVKDWIIDEQAGQAEHVDEVAKLALERNYCSQEQVDIGACLQSLPVERLMEIAGYGWKLVVDNELVGEMDPIETLRKQPHQLTSNVEAILLGETETEGTLCLYRHMLNTQSNYAKVIDDNRLTSNDLYELIRDDSTTYFKFNLTQSNPIQLALEASFSMMELKGELLREKYLDACSSYMVKAHNNRFERHLRARNHLISSIPSQRPLDIHHYSLKYKPSFSLAPEYIETAAHGDDVPLIFGLVYNQPQHLISQADLLMTRKMMSYIGNFVHGNEPLHQEPQQKPIRALRMTATTTTTTTTTRLGWASPSENQVYSIDLTDGDSIQLSLQQLEPALPSITSASSLSQQQQQPQLQQQQYWSAKQERAIDEPSAGNIAEDATEQQGPSQTPAVAKPLKLVELIHRQQLAENGAASSLVKMRKQHQNQRFQATESTSFQSNTTINLLGAELPLMSILLLSSCLVIFALMSICIILSVSVIRCYNSEISPSSSSAQVAKAEQGNSRHFDNSSSTCDICDDSQVDAILNGTGKRERSVLCNLLSKLRNRQQMSQSTIAEN